MNIRTLVVAALSCLILVGCWGWSDATTPEDQVVFDGVSVTVPEGFTQIPSQLVENSQITNKIIYAAKQLLSEEELLEASDYTLNLIISQSLIQSEITFDQFAQVNTEKMQQFMIGYTPGTKEVQSFECGEDQVVQWISLMFTIQDDYYRNWAKYQFYQYQFVYQDNGYIISLASDPSEQKTLKKTFEKILDSLGCSGWASE